MTDMHPDHEAVRSAIAQPQPLPDPEHHTLKQLPPPHVHWARRIALWGGAAIVLVLVIFAVGFLRFSWQRPVLLTPARVLPYPVAIAGGQWISYYDYQQDVPNVSSYLERNYPPDAFAGQNIDRDTYTRKLILNKVIGESIISRLASDKKVVVTDEDIEKTYNAYVQQSGEPEKVPETIQNLYGWSVAQFKEKLIRPQVVQDKLIESYLAEEKTAMEATRERLAKDVQLFADEAKTSSDDVATAAKGGEVTLNSAALKEAYGEEIATSISELQPNKLSAVLETNRGYEIVLFVSKAPAAKVADGTTYNLRRILKQIDPNTWLGDQVNSTAKSMRVMLFEPRFRWEPDCGVLAKSEPTCTTQAAGS